ncbi:class I SAM-dependent methyltransferase [Nostocoides sp. HKS02]|uniref:class I SAM-dependent methyltransferase n=1 Tax=Nostocoides sp. HKS02 TaxID=1813880 RepID=UPI0012B4EBE8|nr:class I SAM-dependent methyltransferase [Tetrasphaera sp. HKS02]QGN59198.1 methyltransferase domain-containing protein [Tetrasphaera sp. HKS02]
MSDVPEGTTAPHSTPGAIDWGAGEYERSASALVPAAEALVAAAHLVPGEHVLDLGCGTGTVALMAARAGAVTIAVDPAARLLEVGRTQAAGERLDIEFLPGEAASLPLPDGAVTAVLSNFGVIFCPDPVAAVNEMVRVLAPEGRIIFTAWLPGGAIGQLNQAAAEMVRAALGAPAPPPPFAWHDTAALTTLFATHDMTVTAEPHELAFTALSPEAYMDSASTHPMAVMGIGVLKRLGQGEVARARMLAILEDGNESPDAFMSTGRFVVITAVRG